MSQQERQEVDRRLREAAAQCLDRYGVRRTTVDELVRWANIPKGTFYLFYPAKEALFFAVLEELQERMQVSFLSTLEEKTPLGWREFADTYLELCREAENSFLLPLMEDGGLDLLVRRLPVELVEKHQAVDRAQIQKIFALFPGVREKDPEFYAAAFRGVFLLNLHRREMGEEHFDGAMRRIVYGLCRQLFAEDGL